MRKNYGRRRRRGRSKRRRRIVRYGSMRGGVRL